MSTQMFGNFLWQVWPLYLKTGSIEYWQEAEVYFCVLLNPAPKSNLPYMYILKSKQLPLHAGTLDAVLFENEGLLHKDCFQKGMVINFCIIPINLHIQLKLSLVKNYCVTCLVVSSGCCPTLEHYVFCVCPQSQSCVTCLVVPSE